MNAIQSELLFKIQRVHDAVLQLLEDEPFPAWKLKHLDDGPLVGIDYKYDMLRHSAIRIDYGLILGRNVNESESKRYQRASKKLEEAGLIERVSLYGSPHCTHFR